MTDPGESSNNNNDNCLELALEGEKLCKTGNCRDGVAFFEAALQTGTEDFRTLSAIYSQLGNAYFYMGDYSKAMQYHKHDLTLARTMGDRLGEAKASGNLGNTLKVMGKFEEAVICCRRHLEICQEHNDRVGEGRALYNLGNVFHAKGKHIGRLGHQDPGEFPDEIKALFEKAVHYYEENLLLMMEIQDRAAQGRACGNVLKLPKNSEINLLNEELIPIWVTLTFFLGEFEKAAEHYKKTLKLAQELGDRAVEAQACYSLGNTYTLLKNYPTAIEYHMRHLFIAQELMDKVGEGRACWSLGNAHSAMGSHEKAYHYATRHLEISKDTGDRMGQATAQLNLAELSKNMNSATPPKSQSRRISMEHLNLLKMTPNSDLNGDHNSSSDRNLNSNAPSDDVLNTSGLVLTRVAPTKNNDKSQQQHSNPAQQNDSNGAASKSVPFLPGLVNKQPEILQRLSVATNNDDHFPDESFFEMLMKCQGSRIEEQRSSLPNERQGNDITLQAPTVPDEDFFSLIQRLQGGRLEDQRAVLPDDKKLG
ncbi:GPSM2 [Lepeophtheirus salmonis]|uniref:GPSM2 n=1 Tax=Lepeophtheirus salmonis TaxID=72036 RepID=A0A7R8H3H7_LEPSM|nr:GPSM2 [Lepeophtheirus salmonis]CAF2831753.1 GPSM2 [Lepeophtheirus salmonis]